MNKLFDKWWFWLIIVFLFLLITHLLFKMPAPYSWMEAVWSAGDFVSFCGTVFLGYITIRQTKYANDMATEANKVSEKLIEFQQREYYPVISITNFSSCSLEKNKMKIIDDSSNKFGVMQFQLENSVQVSYTLSLYTEEFSREIDVYTRGYELHFKYNGKFVLKCFKIKSISFFGQDFNKIFEILNNEDMRISLNDNEEVKIIIYLNSNESFEELESFAHNYVVCRNIKIKLELQMFDNKIFEESILISKDAISKEIAITSKEINRELFVSAFYDINETLNK